MFHLLKRPALWLAVLVLGSLATISVAQQPDFDALPGTALIVDVRTPAEFRAGHFPGARNIPLADLSKRLDEFGDKDSTIVVYCRSGNRSGVAKKILQSAGYPRVFNGGGLGDMLRLAPPTILGK